MPETLQRNYQSFPDMDQEHARTVPGKRFFVHVAGKTNGAHGFFIRKLKGVRNIEVHSPEDSDYLLVFCPVASRVGTDISEALEGIQGDKPIILVVMHHTFDPDKIVAESRRQVEKLNVILTVDTLFDQNGFLDCYRNKDAWLQIQGALPLPPPSLWNRIINCKCGFNNLNYNWKVAAGLGVGLIMLVIILTVIVVEEEKPK